MLEPREYPYCVEYIRDYAKEIHGRSGASQVGLLPVSYSEIRAWARFRGIKLGWHEIEGITAVDMAMLYPGEASGEQ